MKLLFKTTFIIMISFLCLLGSSLAFYYVSVLSQFTEIEANMAKRNGKRILETIASEQELMRVTAIDWAQWDDMYEYLRKPTKKFEESWTTYESYKALKITDTVFLNLEKKPIFAIHVDFDKEEVIKPQVNSPSVYELIKVPGLFNFEGEIPSQAVFGKLNNRIIIAAASPILDSSRSKPAIGYLIIVKQIDNDFLSKIANQTSLELSQIEVEQQKQEESTTQVLSQIRFEDSVTQYISANHLRTFVALKDFADQPIVLFFADQKRPIYKQGLSNLVLFISFWIIASITTILLIMVLLNRFVLARLTKVCAFLNSISNKHSFDNRLNEAGNDELSYLSSDINRMLDSLSSAHHEVNIARLAAEAANNAKSAFIAKVSHELRTPIGCITGINRMIMKREKSHAICDLLKMSDQAAWGLLSIINEILDFTKAESGNLTIEQVPFELRQIVRDSMQIIAGRLTNKETGKENYQVSLITEVNPEIPKELTGDPTKLKQILINLLGNAVRFTPNGYVGLRINIETRQESNIILRIEVWDTGVGIPEEKLDTVFEPFKQANAAITRQFQGTGLGLAIVKQFAEAMGGTVFVQSKIDHGTIFRVLLPFESNGSSSYVLQDRGDKIQLPPVLILAQNSLLRETLVNNLGLFGVKSYSVEDLEKAAELRLSESLLTAKLAVVFEDVLEDRAILRLFQQRAVTPNVQTLVLLRPESLELREELESGGITNILSMPVLAEDIISWYLNQADAQQAQDIEDISDTASDLKLRVLIADDAPTNRIILEDILAESGHEITSVADGSELVELLEPMILGKEDSKQFDIVLTDISMPIMDGYAAAKMIRELEKVSPIKGHIPIIAVTAHALSEETKRMKEAGIDGVVTKPIMPEAIVEEFRRVMASKSSHDLMN